MNVATRLQETAPPGGVLLSATVHEHVAAKLNIAFVDCGEGRLKNIALPVRVFRWSPLGNETAADAPPASAPPCPTRPPSPSSRSTICREIPSRTIRRERRRVHHRGTVADPQLSHLTVASATEAMVFFPEVIKRIAQGLRDLGVPEK